MHGSTSADITFDPEKGAGFVVWTRTDAPSITLPGAIFFGRVDLLMQAAEGEGVVASVVLRSDAGDEIGLVRECCLPLTLTSTRPSFPHSYYSIFPF